LLSDDKQDCSAENSLFVAYSLFPSKHKS